jgi:tetratricopeptide (TPR) repeat protein
MAKRKIADREPPETTQMRLGEMRFVPALSGPRRRMPWDKIDRFLATARAITFNSFVLVALIAIIGFTIAEVRRNVVVIDPIRLPEPLRQMGYSEDVAAHRLWDEVVQINESTPTAKDRVALLPASQQMDFEAPGAGVSLQAVVHMLRTFFDLDETRIAGEFICSTRDCKTEGLALRLRVFRGDGMKIISLSPIGERTGGAEINGYFHTAALELLRELDPYVVAFFLYRTDKEAARREALQLIAPTHPQRKWALNLLGFIAADSGDHDGAIGWYRRAIAADEEDEFAIAYNNWGVALRAKGDPDGAIAKYQRAIDLDPENAFAYSNWGDALSDKGDLDGAIAKHARAAEIDPQSGFAYNSWGNALYIKGDLDGAIAKYMRATELDPEDALAYYNWGIALDDKGDLNGAIAKYMRATELDPEDAAAYTNWGVALHASGDMDGAIAKFMRATELDPENAFAYFNWGGVLGNKGDLSGAFAKFLRATELDPEYANAHFNKALALQMLSRAGDAADAFQRYLDLRPDAGNAERVRALIEELRASAAND